MGERGGEGKGDCLPVSRCGCRGDGLAEELDLDDEDLPPQEPFQRPKEPTVPVVPGMQDLDKLQVPCLPSRLPSVTILP